MYTRCVFEKKEIIRSLDKIALKQKLHENTVIGMLVHAKWVPLQ